MVTELTLNKHQLLVVSNVDAEDAKGNWLEISTWKHSHQNAEFAKVLRAWSQCSVQGVKRLVLGTRNEEGILENIEIRSVKNMANYLDENQDQLTAQCMHFENNLLSFIKEHLPVSKSCSFYKLDSRNSLVNFLYLI